MKGSEIKTTDGWVTLNGAKYKELDKDGKLIYNRILKLKRHEIQ